MTDRLLAFIALACLIGFCVLIVSFIGRIDLTVVTIACLLMAAFDLLLYSFRK